MWATKAFAEMTAVQEHPLSVPMEDLEAAFAQYFGRTRGRQAAVRVEIDRVVERSFSRVAFLKVWDTVERELFVLKMVKHHPMIAATTCSENQAVVEFETLQKLYEAFSSEARCSVPKPVLLFAEHEAYVMTQVPGLLLSDLLCNARYWASNKKFRMLRRHFGDSGRWLRRLQETTASTKPTTSAYEHVVARCEQRLQLIGESGCPLIPRGFCERIRGLIGQCLCACGSGNSRVAGRHGDFGPWNVLADDNGVTVIDFLGYKLDPPAVDLLKMDIAIENEGVGLTSSQKRNRLLRADFLRGYGAPPWMEPESLKICEILQRVVSLWGSISMPAERLHYRIERNLTIRRHVSILWNGQFVATNRILGFWKGAILSS